MSVGAAMHEMNDQIRGRKGGDGELSRRKIKEHQLHTCTTLDPTSEEEKNYGEGGGKYRQRLKSRERNASATAPVHANCEYSPQNMRV